MNRVNRKGNANGSYPYEKSSLTIKEIHLNLYSDIIFHPSDWLNSKSQIAYSVVKVAEKLVLSWTADRKGK